MSTRAPHYCPGCGFDYWRDAAGLGPKLTVLAPAARHPDGRSSAALMVAGFVGLLITGVVTAVVVLGGGGEPEGQVAAIAHTLPSRGPEDFLILRFFREARSPYAAFTVAIDGTVTQVEPAGDEIPLSESMVLHAEDWVIHGSFHSDGAPAGQSAAQIDGAYFVRSGVDTAWVRTDLPTDSDAVSPFARISTVSDVEYLGLELTSGTTMLHHLLVASWLGGSYRDLRMLGFDEITQGESRFDIWVNDDGVPVRGRQVATFSVTEAGVTYTYSADLTLTFGDWGLVESIEAPA